MPDKVVLRYRDGRTERAILSPIDPMTEALSVTRDDGARDSVPFSVLKAVFFPITSSEERQETPPGMFLAVEFQDGEVIRGNALYNPERSGFFLYPADRSKNDRIFVVSSAIASIEVEKM